MFRSLLMPVSLLAAASAGHSTTLQAAPDWVEVFSRQLGSVFLDRASMRREGNQVSATSEARFKKPVEDGTFRHRARWRYDCTGRTAELLSYKLVRIDGSVIDEGEVAAANRERQPLVNDTPNLAIFEQVCRGSAR